MPRIRSKNSYFTYAGIRRLVNRTLDLESKIGIKPGEQVKRSRVQSGVVDLICQRLEIECQNFVIKLNKLAKHTGRSTIKVKDLELFNQLRQ
jgi:histone H3/H4